MTDRSRPARQRVTDDPDKLLRILVEGIASETGGAFFSALVRTLATALGVRHAFVAEWARGPSRVRTLACWSDGALVPNFEFDLPGTPCEEVLTGRVGHHASGLQQLFPLDTALAGWHAESYLGVPLQSTAGKVLGHLAVIDDRPMPEEPVLASVMRIFSMRATAEMERLHALEAVRASEERYRDLYDEAPHAYLSVGTDGRVQRANRTALRLFGYAAQEMIGHPVFQIVAEGPEGLDRARAVFERFLAGIESHNEEVRCRRRDGTTVWVSLSVRPIRDDRGAVVATRSILADITDRKAAEEARRASEERLERVVGSAMDAIVAIDAARRIVVFNQAAETVFRCRASDVLGKPIDGLLTPALRETMDAALDDLASGRRGKPYAWLPQGLSARRADGREFPIEATLSLAETGGERLATLILRDVNDRIEAEKALRELNLHRDYLLEEIKAHADFEEIVGASPGLEEVLKGVELVGLTDSPVLITGETGTGKELIARAVHARSTRRDRPLIKVNCAALPTGLVESELFGHERGAFTGALAQRIGRFELADGGTIFLDEIGDMPAEVQVKLLRVLQEQELERVGGSRTIRVDVRVIAATNRDLAAAARDGSFRSDLYYRLSVFPLHVPPLRERREDIPLLVHYFASRAAARTARPIERIGGDTMRRLTEYAWPGNIRELANLIERAVILSQGPTLEVPAALLPGVASAAAKTTPGRPSPAEPADATLEQIERDHIVATLKRTGWVIEGPTGAARLLELHPNTRRSCMKRLGIRRPAK